MPLIKHDERHVLGRPHPLDRVVKHAEQINTHAHEASVGTLRMAGRVLGNIAKTVFIGSLLSAGTGFALSEAHSFFHSDAGITEGAWPYVVGGVGEVATLGTATVVGAVGFAEVSGHFAKHSAGFSAKVAETTAVGVEAGIDAAFHGVRHGWRRGRAAHQARQARKKQGGAGQ